MRRANSISGALMLLAAATVVPAGTALADAPGGVSGAEAWFHTVYDYSTLKYRWQDRSGNGLKLYTRGAQSTVTEFKSSAGRSVNFNHSLDFSTSDSLKWISIADAPLTQSTVIGVYVPGNAASESTLWTFASGDGLGASAGDRKVYAPMPDGATDYQGLFAAGAPAQIPRIMTYHRASVPETSAWGSRYGSMMTVCSPRAAEEKFLGRQFGGDAPLGGFSGSIPELMVYNRILTPFERKKVESYLAMKYGLTVGSAYVDSQGNEVWDNDGGYHNRVTALVRDDANGFSQTASATMCPDHGLPYGTEGRSLITMRTTERRPMADNSCLIWGDDGGDTEDWSEPEGLWKLFARTWRINSFPAVYKDLEYDNEQEDGQLDWAPDAGCETGSFTRYILTLDPELVRTENSWKDDPRRLKLIVNGDSPDFSYPDGLFSYYGVTEELDDRKILRELDPSKVHYPNIPWDIDGNGCDYFTFGYFFGMEAEVRTIPLNSDEEPPGSIVIKILLGEPEYKYTLMPEELDGSILSEGFFSERDYLIEGLSAGNYYLRLEQGYGMELEGLGSLYYYITIGEDPNTENGAVRLYGSDIPWDLLTDRDRETDIYGSASHGGYTGRGQRREKDVRGGNGVGNGVGDSGVDMPDAEASSGLAVRRIKGAGRRYEARIAWSGAVSLAVYDAQGRLMAETEMEGDAEKHALFEVPTEGVYVIRAITEEKDHTVKLMVK